MRYLILLSLAVITGGISYVARNKGYWVVDNLGPNLCAGFLSSLAILFFIERGIEKRRKEERERIAAVAHREIGQSLRRICDLFASMVKASAPIPFATVPRSFEELFSTANTDNLDWLDLNKPSSIVGCGDWRGMAEVVLSGEKAQLVATMDRYIASLDVPLVEALAGLTEDTFYHFVVKLRSVAESLKTFAPGTTIGFDGTAPMRNAFFLRLNRTIKEFEKAGGKALVVPSSLVREDIEPKTGRDRLPSLPLNPIAVSSGDPPKID